VKLFTFEET